MSRIAAGLLLAMLTSSCVTIGRHEVLEKRVLELEKFRHDTKLILERDLGRLENLSARIKDASATLRKHGASLAAKVDGQADDLRAIRGRIEEVDFLSGRMSAELDVVKRFLDERFGLSVAALPRDVPTEPAQMLEYAEKRFKAGQFDLVRAVLRKFLQDYPAHERDLDVRLLIGSSYHREKRFKQALQAYYGAYKPYAQTPSKAPPKAVEALWLAAKALMDGGDCAKSLDMYRFLSRKHRKSERAEEANRIAKETKCR